MKRTKHSLVASSLLLFLGMNSFADEVYTIQNKTLKEALEIISKKANLSYIANDEVLEKKYTNSIQNIEGTQQALDKLLEGSGLKAIIDDKSIVIVKEQGNIKVVNGAYVLDDVSVSGKSSKNGSAESGYLVEDVKTLGVWGDMSLQDTPYSMSVMSSDFLENTINNTFNEIVKKNPLLQDSGRAEDSNAIGLQTTIRGFGVSKALIDGIPLIQAQNSVSSKELDRIEVISGLSGFLYGSGNVGGVINYALKYPTLKPITKISVGNNGGENYFVDVDTSQNITDKLSVRVNASYSDGDTVIDGKSKEEKLIGVSFAYKPTDNLDLGLYASHREYDLKGLAYFSFNGKRPSAKDFDTKSVYAPDWTYSSRETDKVEAKANYNFSENWKIRTVFIYEKETNNGQIYNDNWLNTTTGEKSVNVQKYGGNEHDNYGGYTYLDGNFDLGSINNNVVIGGSFANYKFDARKVRNWTGAWGVVVNDFSNFAQPNIQPASGWYTPFKRYSTNLTIGDNITFNEQWSALIGANLAKLETKTFNTSREKISGYDKDALTPTFSLIYKPIEDVTTYATYIENLENGMQQPDTSPKAGEFLDPYVSKQYEVGAKWSVNQDLLLSTALFRIEKQNAYENLDKSYSADGEQINEGVEILATGKASENLTLMGGITYVKPTIEKANTFEGKEATRVAKLKAKMWAEYRLPTTAKLFVNGGAYYTGEQWLDNANSEKLPDYTTFDLGARYETKLDGLDTTFRIYTSNITDEKYWAGYYDLGTPRSVAFNVTVKF